jgi:HD-GYP domain-containing protein (c-di-GMP phosphodiesterase class II)
MRFEFVVRSGRETGRTIALTTGQGLTFGRLSTCDVQIDDESVSRRHCALYGRQDGCVVADLQSANGTFVNEKRITTADLHPGDKLRIGSTVLEIMSVATSDATIAPLTTTAFRVTQDEHGQTLIRKSIDPNKLDSLTQALKRDDEKALLESAQRYLSTLHRVSDQLSRATGVETLFDSILSTILEVTGGSRAAILMRANEGMSAGKQDPSSEVKVVAIRTRTGAGRSGDMVLSHTVVRDVLEHGISTFTHDALADSRYVAGQSIVQQRIRSIMCAPMRTTETILGVLYVDSPTTHEFCESELELLAAIGNQAGVALHRARLMADMERLFLDVMKAIAAIIDAKDGYTHRHSERVAAFSVRLARQLGLSPDELGVVELSALLHDVGKIGVRDSILNKPDKLTDEEFEEMRRHPAHGAAILANIQSEKVMSLLPGVKSHHERWDGTGYPDGLKGEEIPLLGRILAVADYLDALSSDRAYRAATPLDDVVHLITQQSGLAFDPSVVEALVVLHEKGELALPTEPAPALRQ